MPDYSTGKIYTIRCKLDDTFIYVGSTIQPLSKRFGGHKKASKTAENQSKLLYSKVENWNDWYIELYENYSCSSVEELRKKEGCVIRQIGTLNKEIAGRTKQEYREENKETLSKQRKEYEEKNKDKIKERKQKYYSDNKDAKKEYYENNIEKIKERKKKHYENKKEVILENQKETLICECGCEVRKTGLVRHKKSAKHNNLLNKDE